MKRHFPLYPPHLSSLFPCSYFDSASICVGSHACNFTIPHFFFLPMLKKKWEKNEGKGSVLRIPKLLQCCIHVSTDILLSSPVPPLLTDGSYQGVWKYCGSDSFHWLFSFGIYDLMIIMRALWSRAELQRCLNQGSNVCHMETTSSRQPRVFEEAGPCEACMFTSLSVSELLIDWLNLKDNCQTKKKMVIVPILRIWNVSCCFHCLKSSWIIAWKTKLN